MGSARALPVASETVPLGIPFSATSRRLSAADGGAYRLRCNAGACANGVLFDGDSAEGMDAAVTRALFEATLSPRMVTDSGAPARKRAWAPATAAIVTRLHRGIHAARN